MSNQQDDLHEFLERRLADRPDGDDSPEREILDALIGWIEGGCPSPRISITCQNGNAFAKVERATPSSATDPEG